MEASTGVGKHRFHPWLLPAQFWKRGVSVSVCLGELCCFSPPLLSFRVRLPELQKLQFPQSKLTHQSSELHRKSTSWRQKQFKEAWESLSVCTGLEQLSAVTTARLGVRPPTLYLRTRFLTLNWNIYDYFSNLWIVESVCQTDFFFLFWCIGYGSTLEHAKLLHRSPAFPLLKQNLHYFYSHHIHCHLRSVLSSASPTNNIILASHSCHSHCNNKALSCCFRIVRQFRHACCSRTDFYSEGHYHQSWESQNVSGSPPVTLWSICIQPSNCAEKTNWK